MDELNVINAKRQFDIGNFDFGGKEKIYISGPCSVESYDSMREIAKELKAIGVNMLRGGIYKPRTSPHDFQGIGDDGLSILSSIKKEFDIPVSTEILDIRDIEKAVNHIDVIQIGTRNMYNYTLLNEVAKTKLPIILKRGMSATIREWILAAEYIAKAGNNKIIFCERGIRSFETITRNTIDINAVAYMKEVYNLPVIVDPSHGTGIRDIVKRTSFAAIACGADGLIIESHVNPDNAISDAAQTIDIKTMKEIIDTGNKINSLLL
ncbi:3-deoxy-D-arabinoheptulosonate-7-phosphate synthase [Clostridium cavendishii DSM 21758]|uniref:3-deoxy-D-arabinoheptulosonate-7-phosphate synthase n=1 Tax=Clostridium cavendishii DSM 21758 TaxID=1121302 RepID=A0A1M6KNN7_9CLOT|nr:3-deoxy-7-phosphoheptulonate synthase [Clostridium cavendishii]SHJ60484.1 3-deoxy-D-arabinoheptulosonate-7-phosphate synthase [Clostridium cavendishii DSM 21758]